MDRRTVVTLVLVFLTWRFLSDTTSTEALGPALVSFVLRIAVFLVAITLHEFGHAAAATWLGDPTPKAFGRLSLNPARHLDPLGTLLILAVQFGFAKPVPINPKYFRRPERDQVLVALAGPGVNFVLCLLSIVAFRAFVPGSLAELQAGLPAWQQVALEGLLLSAILNAMLAVFNLFPVPPLDGSYLLERVLPPYQRWWYRQNQTMLAMVSLMLLIMHVFDPIFNAVARLVQHAALG
jgi:Zn-dependent protease